VLKKAYRLNTYNFKKVYSEGRDKKFSFLLVKWLESDTGPQFGIALSVRLKCSPVQKNNLKRKIFEYVREKNYPEKLDKWVIFIVMKHIDKENIQNLYSEIDKIISFLIHEKTIA
jgi:ribonuclease P protein component